MNEYILFSVLYFYISNWVIVQVSLQNLFEGKTRTTEIKDKKIHDLLKQFTNLDFKIHLVHADRLFGFATKLFGVSQIFLSSRVVSKFSPSELEWILLHEAGHCVLGHTVLIAALQASFWLTGLLALFLLQNSPYAVGVSLVLAFMLSSLYFQFNRLLVESKADHKE
jgi:Zn-dependent protease with chaperone function